MDRLHKILNGAVILAAVVFMFSVTQRYYPHLWNAPRPSPGTIAIKDVDLTSSDKTLLLFLRDDCRICEQSASFYRLLSETFTDPAKVQLVVITPHDSERTTAFLAKHKIQVRNIKQQSQEILGVKGAPTLILTGSDSKVLGAWVGELSSETEANIIDLLRH